MGIGFSSVAVSQGRLFSSGNTNGTDTVYCFDAATGRCLWRHSYPCPLDAQYYEGGPGATPTVAGDRVFTLGKHGQLFCLEAASGRVLWQKDLMAELGVTKPRWGFAGSPLVEGALVVLNVGGAGMALAQTDGRVVWTSNREAAGYATPVPYTFHGERQVALFSAKALIGVRLRDGREVWRFPWATKWDLNIADPIIQGDEIFISTFDRGAALLQLQPGAPRVVWETRALANHFSGSVLLGGYLYGLHGNTDEPERDLRCLEWRTGAVKWRHAGLGLGALMAADGKLLLLTEKGELDVITATPAGFRPVAQAQVLGGKCWTTPVLANGRVYCRNAQGALVCLDLRGHPSHVTP